MRIYEKIAERLRLLILILAAAGLPCAVSIASDKPPDAKPDAETDLKSSPVKTEEGSAIEFTDRFELIYDGRITSYNGDDKNLKDGAEASKDHKLRQSAEFDLKEKSWGHFRLFFYGELIEDLDGTAGKNDGDRTSGVFDSFGERVYPYLYQLAAEINDLSVLDFLRLGRQYVSRQFSAHIDGANISLSFLDKKALTVFAYGGIPVRFYDDADYLDALQLGGGFCVKLPWKMKISAEYQALKDKPGEYGYSTVSTDAASAIPTWDINKGSASFYHQAGVTVSQPLFDAALISLSMATLDKKARYVKANAAYQNPDWTLDVYASYFYQFIEITETPSAISPFAALMGPIKPHQNFSLDLFKGLYSDKIFLSLGTSLRLLGNGESDSQFNHSFHHEYLGLTFRNLLLEGLELNLHGDIFQRNEDTDNVTFTGGGEVSYAEKDSFKAAVGGYYSLYKYDYYLDQNEKNDVYTFFVSGKYNFLSWLYASLKYELNAYDAYEHRITAVVGQQF